MSEPAPAPRLYHPPPSPGFRLHPDGPRTVVKHDKPGWIFVEMHFDRAGQHVHGHAHAFDHDMLVLTGGLYCVADDVESIHYFGSRVLIPKGVVHSLRALTGGTIAQCQHEIRTENGAIDPLAFSPDGFPIEWLMRITDPGWRDSA